MDDCKDCICLGCPHKSGCTYGGWKLVEWCERADQHYCGDCHQTECEVRAQGCLYETIS